MSIEARPPATHPGPEFLFAETVRRGGEIPFDIAAPPFGDLLPSDGTLPAPAPSPAPAWVLAMDALRVRRRLLDRALRPDGWSAPGFARDVDLIRSHLAPVRSRGALAASFSREAFHVSPVPRVLPLEWDVDGPSAVRVAYALRWLELRDGTRKPAWSTLLD
ncbi:MAG: hypothetical protein H0U37_10555 [Chloroflexi bacterium]|nr:hypothetical protein [Chloroflexota bacterium]